MKFDRVFKMAGSAAALALGVILSAQAEPEGVKRDLTRYVNQFIGSSHASKGHLRPLASVPFGMVQFGPDTRIGGPGYVWEDDKILGFTHTHMTGGGCNDYMDILFMPVVEDTSLEPTAEDMRQAYGSVFSHEFETSLPGYYRVLLQDENITAELTASERCAVHRYTYPSGSDRKLLIDLLHGARGSCTIVREDSKTIVHDSFLRQVDAYTIEGYRVSSSWAQNQHAYFSATFSAPITAFKIFSGDEEVQTDSLHCTRLKAVVEFGESDRPLEIKMGISPVSMEGARKNRNAEIGDSGFDEVCARAVEKWEKQLSKFRVETDDEDLRTIFYSCLHNVFLYPMLYSDVDGKFRGPDHEVHQADGFDYYAGVLGLWDNFRAANPLLTIANPEIANEQIHTFLAHYNICGLLPIWTLAGYETLTMIGYHAMPMIADAYYKGVRDYDVDAVFEAMKASANKDEFGLSMRRMMGTKNYKKYGYIPADLEFESVAQTLEFSYDDWCIAQMAKMLGRDEDYKTFMERSKSYRNIIDPETKFARGRMTDGSWRTPFDPRASTHRRDDYCEGNAWQWTFFVPHDPAGLSEIMGGKKELEKKLDGLFSAPSGIVGEHRSGDISGLIGQYAHGNEPSHHTAYLYNFAGAPWKTQNMIDRIMREMYANNPDGVCGNDDTGQMSAWYVFSAMGFYPVTHGTGRYEIGTPLLDRIVFRHGDNNEHTLTIVAKNRPPENKYIKRILLDGKPYLNTFFRHEDIFVGDHEIVCEMTDDYSVSDFHPTAESNH